MASGSEACQKQLAGGSEGSCVTKATMGTKRHWHMQGITKVGACSDDDQHRPREQGFPGKHWKCQRRGKGGSALSQTETAVPQWYGEH